MPGHHRSFEGKGQHLAQGVDLVLDAVNVIGHVAEEGLHGGFYRANLDALHPAADIDQSGGGVVLGAVTAICLTLYYRLRKSGWL